MYVSDEKTFNGLGIISLIALPWIGAHFGIWGIIWDLLLLGALFLVARFQGGKRAALFMAVGYGLAVIGHGFSVVSYIGFVPWAGLILLVGAKKAWPEEKILLWALVGGALLSVLPNLQALIQTLTPEVVDETVKSFIRQYEESGTLTALQQQGITTVQLESLLERFINFYFSIMPAIAAIFGCLEIGLAYLLFRKWLLPDERRKLSFSTWRLPWYTVYAVILAIASYLLGDQFGWSWLTSIGINSLVVCGAVALFLGISVYVYFLRSKKVPRFLKIITVILNIIYFYLTIFIFILFGVFDMVLNFRRLPDKAENDVKGD